MSVAAIFVMGIVIELILLKSGVITYHGLTASDSFPPLWILALWLAFAPLPDGALSWLQNRWALQVLFGAVGGPLSYLAGEKLGAATLHDNRLFAIAVLALAWSIATPLCFRFVARFSKRSCAIKAA